MLPPRYQPPIDTLFDVEFANALAHYETYNKHHYRPNTYLHKWWGRRCGSTFRLILKGLVEDNSLASYYKPGGLAGKVILDPMMGGGTTLHEAIRLGASVVGVDVDPIPILQGRATMTGCSLSALQTGFQRLFEQLTASAGDLFRTHCPTCDEPAHLWYSLYGLRRRCACREVLVVDSLLLRHEPDGSILSWCPDCGELCNGGEHDCSGSGPFLIEKNRPECERCGEHFKDFCDSPYYTRYVLLTIAGHCDHHGLFHRSPDWRDRAVLARADELRSSLPFRFDDYCIDSGDKSVQLINRNIHNYLDLYSSRQLLILSNVSRFLPDDDPVIRLNLALLVSTSLEFNSLLCGYKGVNRRRAGAVRHTFSHHGYSFPYTALENNPIYPRRASGTLQKLFYSRIVRGRRWAAAPQERLLDSGKPQFITIQGEQDVGVEAGSAAELHAGPQRFLLIQGSSGQLPLDTGSIDAVITDPPYYDSIQYGDLSAYFRVWLRQFLPEAADWGYDVSAAAVNSERTGESDHYIDLMSAIFKECSRVLRPECGRLVFTFHHWQPRAWAALNIALHGTGFKLLNRYIVHAEHPMSVHINKMRALTHDAILVFAKPDEQSERKWPRPAPPKWKDSYRFTESCATFLGWVLQQSELTAEQIENLWLREYSPHGHHSDAGGI